MAWVPVMVNLDGKQAVVIGGGKVAARRFRLLQEAGACVTVVSPHLNDELQVLAQQHAFIWKQKTFETEDIRGADVVVAATNDPETNSRIVAHAPAQALVNDAGHAGSGNLAFPAFFQKGRLSISVSTAGASPKLASRIVNELSGHYDTNYAQYVDFLYECRQLLKQPQFSASEKSEWLEKLLGEAYRKPEKQQEALSFFRSRMQGTAR
ncbi:NAD(P)-binding protein [Heyndrickxia coagulans]|uniref:NAD(P)-binding protein n=1 Tax=Heyndrickxia coagulans TaxID=1398 RepID=UPI003D1BE260